MISQRGGQALSNLRSVQACRAKSRRDLTEPRRGAEPAAREAQHNVPLQQRASPSAPALGNTLCLTLERPLQRGVMLHAGTLQLSPTSRGECFMALLFLPAWQQPLHSNPHLTRTGKSLRRLAGLHNHAPVPTNLPSRPC